MSSKTTHYCDICSTNKQVRKQVEIPYYDTLNKELNSHKWDVCQQCLESICNQMPVIVYGINNRYTSNRLPKFREECQNDNN